jgi:exosortase H (IPTLxxWG-CTERM-specific)
MTRFLVSFIILLLFLSFAANYEPVRESMVEPWNGWLASGSYWFIQWFDSTVAFSGNVLYPVGGGGGVAIESGCNGIEAIIILVSAMVAFPGQWWTKVAGVLIGAALIQGLNLMRIISLFYLVQWNHAIFEWFHLYLWPTLIILDALIIFFIWSRLTSRNTIN